METKFSIGEKVIALSNTPIKNCQNRTKGTIYVVKNVHYCSKCGTQSINLGELVPLKLGHKIACAKCGNRYLHEGLMWTYSAEFAKIDHSSLKEAVEAEDYELACIIRDNLTN